jgi:hypothetical protein
MSRSIESTENTPLEPSRPEIGVEHRHVDKGLLRGQFIDCTIVILERIGVKTNKCKIVAIREQGSLAGFVLGDIINVQDKAFTEEYIQEMLSRKGVRYSSEDNS